MNRFPKIAFLALAVALVAPLTAGCSASETAEAESADSDIVQGTSLGDIAAVKIGDIHLQGPTVAAPSKVARVLENLGLSAKEKTAREEVEVLGTPQVIYTLYGPKGEVAATAFFVHIDGTSGSRDPKNAKGTLFLGGKTYALTAMDLDAITAIGK